MASSHRRTTCSPALLAQTRQVWQGHYERPLSEEDAAVMTGNMVDFIEVLMEWEKKDAAQHR